MSDEPRAFVHEVDGQLVLEGDSRAWATDWDRSHREEVQGEIDAHQAALDVIGKLLNPDDVNDEWVLAPLSEKAPHCRHCGVGVAGIPAAHRGGPCPTVFVQGRATRAHRDLELWDLLPDAAVTSK